MATKLLLRDGRTLAWRTYGLPTGLPVIFAHGNLNSRLFHPTWSSSDSHAREAGARIIAVDRPGYGLSTRHPGRTYPDWAADVRELAISLGLGRFALVGFSSGGPHSLAAASVLSRDPEFSGRVAACGLVSSDGPYHKMGGELMVELMYGRRVMDLGNALEWAEENAAGLRRAYDAMQNDERRQMAQADLAEATRQGYDGAASDSVLESSEEWGFDMRPDEGVPVLIWHGTDDQNVPVEAAEYFAEACCVDDKANLTIVEGENHTLIRRRWHEILKRIVAVATVSKEEMPAGARL